MLSVVGDEQTSNYKLIKKWQKKICLQIFEPQMTE
jgi:hypothetical protein